MRVIENCPPPPPERTFTLEVTESELRTIQEALDDDWEFGPVSEMLDAIALAL